MENKIKKEVELLLKSGKREEAIQYLQESFSISLQDAQTLIEALEREVADRPEEDASVGVATAPIVEAGVKTEVVRLLQEKRKAEAVQFLRKHVPMGLGEALVMVEALAKEINPHYRVVSIAGCLHMLFKGVGLFLLVVSVVFLAAAGVIYFLQEGSINQSDLVSGEVTEMYYLDEGAGAPVMQYEWRGKKHSYASKTYSSPPEYEVGQTVSLYVNREEPHEVIVDTFSERHALIVGLAVIGTFLLIISIVFINFGRKKF